MPCHASMTCSVGELARRVNRRTAAGISAAHDPMTARPNNTHNAGPPPLVRLPPATATRGTDVDVVGRSPNGSRSVVGVTLGGVVGAVGTRSPGSSPAVAGVSSCEATAPVTSSAPGAPRPGVGSNWTQPMPSNHTSGQAWAWRPSTVYWPSERTSPWVKPTATRAGNPTARAITANVPANCSQ